MSRLLTCPECDGTGLRRYLGRAGDPLEVGCSLCDGRGTVIVVRERRGLIALGLAALSGALVGSILTILVASAVDAASRPEPEVIPAAAPLWTSMDRTSGSVLAHPAYGAARPDHPARTEAPPVPASPPPPSPATGTRTATVRAPRTAHSLRGKASWHATGRDGMYAAACWRLRQAIGASWRGRRAVVVYGGRRIVVRLNDYCASRDKTIDLSDEAFRALAPGGLLSRGVLRVTVRW